MAREPRRKPLIQGDTGRVLAGTKRRAATGAGVPEEIDQELTPLPSEPPEFVEGLDDLPEPAQAAIQALNTRQREQDVTIARMHHVRHLDQDIANLRELAVSLTEQLKPLQNVPALLNAHAVQIRELQTQTQTISIASARQIQLMDKCTEQLQSMQIAQVKSDAAWGELSTSVRTLVANDKVQDKRLDEIDDAKRDALVVKQERRRWFSWGKAAYAVGVAIAVALGAIGTQLAKWMKGT